MSTEQMIAKPDMKISVKQTFGIETDMEINAFSKKMNLFLKLTKTINLTKILHLQFLQVFHLIKEY